ncbi:hypothetical protein CIL03_03380 [Virgibacillus indicus]|uniref:ABC transmembrane type-1 domain-containing protein n=2 Tax=Virgibacillus indicus TaxID=2024554 RepID=A0A265NDT4_9BACI|nr:hypothetical protein CIL03_03380 [Virgibacillus indicus]
MVIFNYYLQNFCDETGEFMRIYLSVTGVIVFIFLLAAFPLALDIASGNLSFHFDTAWKLVKDYFGGIISGDSFYYLEGKDRNQSFLKDVPGFFLTSFLYLITAAIISVCIGVLIAVWHSKSKQEWIKDIIGFLGMIPDFILVLILQLGVVFIYEATGERIARIATRGVGEHAILLPLITLSIVPAIYLIRTLGERTYDVLSEDYILTAKAKGLQKLYIFIQHVIRNVLPYLKADLHKVIAIMMSNIFIVEYLFNINGLSAFLFNVSYQFDLTVNILISLIVLYLLLYWGVRLFIACLERIFSHD